MLVSVDTDREKAIAERFGVRSLSSCMLFRRGVPLEHLHGMQTEGDYRGSIERHLVAPASGVESSLDHFAEIHRRDETCRDGIGRRGLPAIRDHLGPGDPRLTRDRRLLLSH
ncbi:MAG: hypothetical protein LJE60_11565 [Thiocapsa sp.]|nr:hypothetical protein [Thiocapsa sp.]